MSSELEEIEKFYQKTMKEVVAGIHEGVIDIDLSVLHNFGLLQRRPKCAPHFTAYFKIIESEEKITLINECFVIWIVPDRVRNVAMTYVVIALRKNSQLHLELAFTAFGIYNNSRLVLHLLEAYLDEILETEALLAKLQHTADSGQGG